MKPCSRDDIVRTLWGYLPSSTEQSKKPDAAVAYLSGVIDALTMRDCNCVPHDNAVDWSTRVADTLDAFACIHDPKEREYLRRALELVLRGEKSTITGVNKIFNLIAKTCNASQDEVHLVITNASVHMLVRMSIWSVRAIFGTDYDRRCAPPTWAFLAAFADAIRQERV